MKVVKTVLLAILILSICCIAVTCSYIQLERRYQKLESRQQAHLNWLERFKSDNEGGVKHAFASKLESFKKTQKKVVKGIDKMAKSGTKGVKQVIKKKLQKKEKKEKVQMEEFEVEIGEFD